MQNPASPPKLMHTCPTCKRPVEPGYKFCEACGTHITELSTCSKCGTQFLSEGKFCDLCGAPLIQGEVPEDNKEKDTRAMEEQAPGRDGENIPEPVTDVVPEDEAEEDTGADEEPVPEDDEEEIPEQESDEVPEDDEEEIPEQESVEVPEDDEEEIPEQESDEVPEDDEEEIPEQESDEVPEDDEEGDPGTDEEQVPEDDEEDREPVVEETPHPAARDNKEPYTDALLKKYGAEYSDEETVGSHRKQKPEPVNDALFFSHKKPGTPAKKRAGTTRIIGGVVVLAALIAAVYFFGLPMLSGDGGPGILGNLPALEITPTPAPSSVVIIQPTPTDTTTQVSSALVPLPTQLVPTDQKFYFQVRKNPVTLKISVIFTGSAGVGGIESADVKVTHPDGAVSTGIIQPLKGQSEITLSGSKEADRVVIIAQMYSGETYRVYDDLVSV
ncbi:MAG: zinc ribbon domain-containing protein [Methanoregula sp.]